MKEDEFFANIARRLGRSTPLTEQPGREVVGAPEFWTEYQITESEKIERFQVELEKLGGSVQVYDTVQDLQSGLRELLLQLSPTSIGMWGGNHLADIQIQDLLTPYQVFTWESVDSKLVGNAERERLLASFTGADISITGADYAIADTGSIVMMSSPEKGRSVSLLPGIHIVILRANQLVTRMGEVLSEISQKRSPQEMPSCINFITGPSRSSDIENDLTIGVHGPVAMYTLILRTM